MSFANQIFEKDINNITPTDLIEFFKEERQETSTLEFKSGDSEIESITKEVCAFLNTDGGLLVYGAPREREIIKGNKHCIGDLIPTNKVKNKVSLASSIAANISPSPTNLKVHQLDMSNGSVYIIEVPKSIHPPHQVNKEGKYYIRLDTEAKAAPHGLVEALFFKRQKPNLDLSVDFTYQSNNPVYSDLIFSLSNDSEFTAENIGFRFEIFGIKKVGDTSKYVDLDFNDFYKKVVCNSQFQNPIIVKGITYNIVIPIIPCMIQNIIIHCLIWCKDLNARSYYFSLDHLNFKQPEEIYYSEIGAAKPELDTLLAPYYAFLTNTNK